MEYSHRSVERRDNDQNFIFCLPPSSAVSRILSSKFQFWIIFKAPSFRDLNPCSQVGFPITFVCLRMCASTLIFATKIIFLPSMLRIVSCCEEEKRSPNGREREERNGREKNVLSCWKNASHLLIYFPKIK